MISTSGDVIIWKSSKTSICQVAVIMDDGQNPKALRDWQTKGGAEAEEWARTWTKETGGRILLWDGSGEPTPL